MITIILITAIFLLLNGLPLMKIYRDRWPWERSLVLLVLGLVISLELSPTARAVDPPPAGGYPGNNTAEGDYALFSLTTRGRAWGQLHRSGMTGALFQYDRQQQHGDRRVNPI